MKKILLLSAAVFALGGISTASVFADDHHDHHEEEHHDDHDHEDRVDHYEGKTFDTPKAAHDSLIADNAKIADILKSDTLTDAQLEQIHQISYGLEDAIDMLIGAKAGDAADLAAIDEAIQAVHYASENHEEAKVREWFAKLEPAVAGLDGEKKADASAGDNTYEIRIKDHKFTPEEIHVPANQKIKLVVFNDDATPEEFESDDFRREKIIAGNSKATIHVGPLKPGKYHYFGEFNLDTANGYLYAE